MIDQLKLLDVIDIAIVSTLIYAAYTLFRRTRTARTIIGLVAIGVVYLLARQFDLRLTLTILQAFFAVIIIALIVIFQDEIRRMFERIGNQRWFSLKGNWEQGTISSIEKRILTIVETVNYLANKRIGGLIVIEGTYDVLSIITGGIALNGNLSSSIIKSIFDPHSQGHDGAIIISGDIITRFACHLPLSTDISKLSDYAPLNIAFHDNICF